MNAVRLGSWSAILTAVLPAATVGVGIFGTSYTAVPRSYPYSIPFNSAEYLWLYPAILLAPAFVTLLACMHASAREDRRVFGLVALAFDLIFAVITIVCFVLVVLGALLGVLFRRTGRAGASARGAPI